MTQGVPGGGAPAGRAETRGVLATGAATLFRTLSHDPADILPSRIPAPPASSTMPALSLHDDILPLEAEWRAFEAEADCTVFQTFVWQANWLKHAGPHHRLTPAVICGRDAAGVLLFIMPLAVTADRRGRALEWLAGSLNDYNGPLLRRDFSALVGKERFTAIWTEILHRLAGDDRYAPDAVSLEKMPGEIGGQPNPFLHLAHSAHPSGAYETRLSGDWETYYRDKRSSATRRHDRAKQKKLAALGELRFVEPAGGRDLDDTITTLYRQKAVSFARMGVADLFGRPGHAALFRELAMTPANRGTVHISRLDSGMKTIAVNYGLVFKKRYYHILSSYDEAGPAAKHGPGAAHLLDIMRRATELGCDIFDFTIGDEPYKLHWSDRRLQLSDHHAMLTARGSLITVPATATAHVKRFIKRRPALLRLAMRLRTALLGRTDKA